MLSQLNGGKRVLLRAIQTRASATMAPSAICVVDQRGVSSSKLVARQLRRLSRASPMSPAEVRTNTRMRTEVTKQGRLRHVSSIDAEAVSRHTPSGRHRANETPRGRQIRSEIRQERIKMTTAHLLSRECGIFWGQRLGRRGLRPCYESGSTSTFSVRIGFASLPQLCRFRPSDLPFRGAGPRLQ